MSRYQNTCLFVLLFSLALGAYAGEKDNKPDMRGSVSADNVYANPALGMTIKLPGNWALLDITSETPNDPGCTGPLCGPPNINVVLESKAAYRLYLSGWKLSGQYLNRTRYPLKWFAQIMLEGSLAGTNLVPVGDRTALQLGGKPAFRLLTARRGEATPTSLGYVSESNGYVFLMVGATRTDPQRLQSAIEAMKFD